MSRDGYGARVEFTSGLSDRLAQIRGALEELRQRPHDTGLFAETRNSVQELAGRAGAFGLTELSEIGLRLEQALVAWRGRGAVAWAAIASADAALSDFEDRLAPPLPAAPWRVVGAGR
jgi:HPt (histidine-containing phosphotransfer) domain-containing protein